MAPGSGPPAAGVPRVRSHCRFRNRGAELCSRICYKVLGERSCKATMRPSSRGARLDGHGGRDDGGDGRRLRLACHAGGHDWHGLHAAARIERGLAWQKNCTAAAVYPRHSYLTRSLQCTTHSLQHRGTGTCTKAVFSGTKSPPIEGRCALAPVLTPEPRMYIATIVRARIIEHLVQSECSLRWGFDTNWSLRRRPARH
jgi:hypothetical protein